MAYTSIHNIKKTLKKALAYIENPDKTEQQLLVSGYNCDPLMAAVEFEMTATLAKEIKGDFSRIGGKENLAQHLIQSFAPYDNITPVRAHELGKQLADEFLQGRYEYVITTHVDKGHIHNHIIFNSYSFYDFKKFENYKVAGKIRDISDRICLDNGLYVAPKKSRRKYVSYYEHAHRKARTSWVAELETHINDAIEYATDLKDFCRLLHDQNINVKNAFSGKHISFEIDVNGEKKVCRGYIMGEDFTRDKIAERISMAVRKRESYHNGETDFANRVEKQSYSTKFAYTQELVAALTTIREANITAEGDFDIRSTEVDNRIEAMKKQMQMEDAKNAEYKKIAGYLVTYQKYNELFETANQKILGRKAFIEKHQNEFQAFNYARQQIQERGLSPDIDIDKILELVKNRDEHVAQLHKSASAAEQMAIRIRQAKNLVNEILKDSHEHMIKPFNR